MVQRTSDVIQSYAGGDVGSGTPGGQCLKKYMVSFDQSRLKAEGKLTSGHREEYRPRLH